MWLTIHGRGDGVFVAGVVRSVGTRQSLKQNIHVGNKTRGIMRVIIPSMRCFGFGIQYPVLTSGGQN